MKRTEYKNTFKLFSRLFLFAFTGCIFTACANNTKQSDTYYMVSYISSAGEAPKPIKVKGGTVLSFEELPEITSENYTFNGWYIEDTKIFPGTYSVTDNTVLTASWTGKECTATFTHSDNINGNTFTKVFNLGEEIVLPDNPYGEKTGLDFLGWLYDNVYYKEGETFIIREDSIFTAVYAELGTYTISYYNVVDGSLYNGSDFNEIEFLIGTENPTTFTESQSVFISGVKKIGYTFGGWYNSVDCLPQDKAVTFWRAGEVQQNIVFYAKWTMESYTIVFDGNSGTLKDVNDEQESYHLRFDSDITLPDCRYELTGYDFVGWTLDAEIFENEFDEEAKISVAALAPFAQGNTITLYAHWRDAILPDKPTNFSVLRVDKNSVSLRMYCIGFPAKNSSNWLKNPCKSLIFSFLCI